MLTTTPPRNTPDSPEFDLSKDLQGNPLKFPRLSGGEIKDPLRAEYLRLHALLKQEPDVFEVLALAKLPDHNGRWLYWIKTPFATYPKHVIGVTDSENKAPKPGFLCGTEWSAADAWKEACEEYGVEVLL